MRTRAFGKRAHSTAPVRASQRGSRRMCDDGRSQGGRVRSMLASEGGLRAGIIDAIADGRRPERMAQDEEILYTLCDELHRNQSVSDATYAKAVSAFGEQGVVDALGITGYYTMLAMVLNTART